MTNTPETIIVPDHADEVACDGGNPALGHPLVYYNMKTNHQVTCGYCGRIFKRQFVKHQ